MIHLFSMEVIGNSFLFTGDLEKEGEEELMTCYPKFKSKGPQSRTSRF